METGRIASELLPPLGFPTKKLELRANGTVLWTARARTVPDVDSFQKLVEVTGLRRRLQKLAGNVRLLDGPEQASVLVEVIVAKLRQYWKA